MGRPMAERWRCPRTARSKLDGAWAQLGSEGGASGEVQGKERCHERARAGQGRGGEVQTQCWTRRPFLQTRPREAKEFARLDSRASSAPLVSLLGPLVYSKSTVIDWWCLNVFVKITHPFDITFICFYYTNLFAFTIPIYCVYCITHLPIYIFEKWDKKFKINERCKDFFLHFNGCLMIALESGARSIVGKGQFLSCVLRVSRCQPWSLAPSSQAGSGPAELSHNHPPQSCQTVACRSGPAP